VGSFFQLTPALTLKLNGLDLGYINHAFVMQLHRMDDYATEKRLEGVILDSPPTVAFNPCPTFWNCQL